MTQNATMKTRSNRKAKSKAMNRGIQDERQLSIEVAAYYKAEKRCFCNGSPVQDWLEAERDVDASIASPRSDGGRDENSTAI